MNQYIALITLCFVSFIVSSKSFMPTNSKCDGNYCLVNDTKIKLKLKKVVKDLLKKSEKIKNILIFPEPEDKEDWDSGEIPWDPKPKINHTIAVNTTKTENLDSHPISSYSLGMLIA